MKKFFVEVLMKRTDSLIRKVLGGFVLMLIISSCSHGSGGGNWLAGLDNPFLGKWQSDIPSAGMTLIFDYKTDGTFDYEMVGVPADQGGKGTGGYLVKDNIMVSYLAFEGVAGYTFKVVDKDTIDVTEITSVKADGDFVLGSTAPFTRVPDSAVNRENKPFVLNHPYLGTWRFEADMDGHHYLVEYKMNRDGTYGVRQNIDGSASSYTARYFVYDRALIVYVEGEGFSEAAITVVDSNHITVSDGDETGYLERVP